MLAALIVAVVASIAAAFTANISNVLPRVDSISGSILDVHVRNAGDGCDSVHKTPVNSIYASRSCRLSCRTEQLFGLVTHFIGMELDTAGARRWLQAVLQSKCVTSHLASVTFSPGNPRLVHHFLYLHDNNAGWRLWL